MHIRPKSSSRDGIGRPQSRSGPPASTRCDPPAAGAPSSLNNRSQSPIPSLPCGVLKPHSVASPPGSPPPRARGRRRFGLPALPARRPPPCRELKDSTHQYLSGLCQARRCRACLARRASRDERTSGAAVGTPEAPSSAPIGVAVVRGSASVRTSLRRMLARRRDFQLCGLFSSAAEAVKLAGLGTARLALVDAELADGCGIACARGLAARWPRLKLVTMSRRKDAALARLSRMAGASFHLVQPFACSRLLAALLMAVEAKRPVRSLSPEEHQLVAGMAQGLRHKQIEAQLSMSAARLKKIQHRAFQKLRVRTSAQAAATWAVLQGERGGGAKWPLPRVTRRA